MEKHIFKQLYGVLPYVKPIEQRVTFLLSHSTQQQVEIEQTRFLSTVPYFCVANLSWRIFTLD